MGKDRSETMKLAVFCIHLFSPYMETNYLTLTAYTRTRWLQTTALQLRVQSVQALMRFVNAIYVRNGMRLQNTAEQCLIESLIVSTGREGAEQVCATRSVMIFEIRIVCSIRWTIRSFDKMFHRSFISTQQVKPILAWWEDRFDVFPIEPVDCLLARIIATSRSIFFSLFSRNPFLHQAAD